MSQSSGVLLYVDDPLFEKPRLLQCGYPDKTVAQLETVCYLEFKLRPKDLALFSNSS